MRKHVGENPILKIIAKNIQRWRDKRKMSRDELAKKLKRPLTFVENVESGKYDMGMGAIGEIAIILEVPYTALMKGTGLEEYVKE